MASGIYTEIKNRIELAEPGTVFLSSDFTDIATTTTVKNVLEGRLKRKTSAESLTEFMKSLYIAIY